DVGRRGRPDRAPAQHRGFARGARRQGGRGLGGGALVFRSKDERGVLAGLVRIARRGETTAPAPLTAPAPPPLAPEKAFPRLRPLAPARGATLGLADETGLREELSVVRGAVRHGCALLPAGRDAPRQRPDALARERRGRSLPRARAARSNQAQAPHRHRL